MPDDQRSIFLKDSPENNEPFERWCVLENRIKSLGEDTHGATRGLTRWLRPGSPLYRDGPGLREIPPAAEFREEVAESAWIPQW